MPDIIQLLPDSVANQIAAGEVIQRPASVVKELTENSIDSGTTRIIVNVKDAGRTLIQVSDNGCGMSGTDARMAFERHATSKIRHAADLFAIRTMGFRGEALASIAAIADVELQTRLHEEEIGTLINISGSKLVKQEPVTCAAGSNFSVKSLFFNVPARRKFLKSNATELKHIISEIQRIALANPETGLSLFHNGQPIYELAVGDNIKKRIIGVFGKSTGQTLVSVNVDTTLIKIKGYIGQPKYARKTFGEQFFFVNNRFMRHPFFHRAVVQAYEKILSADSIPSYFLFFEVNPVCIDINIHPTKTEIKFEDETAIWQVIHASVREALGKFNVVPSIDFDQSGSIEIPLPLHKGETVAPPEVKIDPLYNPFERERDTSMPSSQGNYSDNRKGDQLRYWERLYGDVDKKEKDILQKKESLPTDGMIEHVGLSSGKVSVQFKNKYILTPVKSGLMVIDQKRAHERILYEDFLNVSENSSIASQQQLYPETIELDASDAVLLKSVSDELKSLGFDIRESGEAVFIMYGTPCILDSYTPREMIERLLDDIKETSLDLKTRSREKIALSLAVASAVPYGHALKPEEIDQLIDRLFACSTPNFSPSGKTVLTIVPVEQFEKLLK